MSSKIKSFIDYILKKFSYSTKLRFIILTGNVPLFLLIIMCYFLLNIPLKSLERQIVGMNHIEQYNELFYDLVNYFMNEKSLEARDLESLNIKIDEKVNSLVEQGHQWIALSPEKDKLIGVSLIQKLHLFQEQWKQINKFVIDGKDNAKLSLERDEFIDGMLINYGDILKGISIFSQLSVNIDTGTGYLINALTNDLPQTQINIINALLKTDRPPLNSQDRINFLASLKLINTNLTNNNHQLYLDSTEGYKHLQTLFKTQGLNFSISSYLENVSRFVQYLDLLIQDGLEAHLKNLFDLGKETIKNSFGPNKKLYNLVQASLLTQKKVINSLLWMCIILLSVGTAIAWLLYTTRVIRHPLQNLVSASQKLSKGDLSIRVPITTRDEVARMSNAFNEMTQYFENILTKATQIIDHLATTSKTITFLAKELESNMNAEEKTVKEIATYARGVQRTVEDFATVVEFANKGAAVTSSLAMMGRSNLHQMENIMQEMLHASTNIVKILSELRDKLRNINDVILTIVKIADQSNLLSLNTAIRATKSGQEGRGFFVIADKIREMADQIAFATLDIEKLVIEIVGSVQDTVLEVDKFSEQIRKQVLETTEISVQLKALIDATQEQIRDFEQIHMDMQNQTQGILEINHVIEELRVGSQEAALSVRKLYLEIEYLYDFSHNLQEKTKNFTFSSKN